MAMPLLPLGNVLSPTHNSALVWHIVSPLTVSVCALVMCLLIYQYTSHSFLFIYLFILHLFEISSGQYMIW